MMLVEMQQNLTIRISGEGKILILLLQLFPQLNMVVDLTIDRQRNLLANIGDGLGAGQQAVDGEPLVGQVTVAKALDTVPVGAAVPQQLRQGENLENLKFIRDGREVGNH